MSNRPVFSYVLSSRLRPSEEVPRRTLQVFIYRPTTQQTPVSFQLPSIVDNQGDFCDATTEAMEFLLTYHGIRHPISSYLIDQTSQFVINVLTASNDNMTSDLDTTLSITDNNLNATARLDVDLVISDLEETIRSPTPAEEDDACPICYEDYSHGNNLCSLTCGHKFHFHCIDGWLRRNLSCPVCRETDL